MKLLEKIESLCIENNRTLPLIEEIRFKTTGDTSDENVSKISFEIMSRKVNLANVYSRKRKKDLFENELFLANTIIQSIFASEFELQFVDGQLKIEKYFKK